MSVSKKRRVILCRCAFTLILFFILLNQVDARDITVRGRVTDTQGRPLAGISVMVEGTQQGYATDSQGYYRIQAPADAMLVFSAIGMEELKMPVNGRSLIDVTLKENVF